MIERPTIPKLAAAEPAKPRGMRPVYFGGAFRETPIYDRSALPAGFRLEGPAVIEEFGSTTVVFPGQRLDVDQHGILIVTRVSKTAEASR
jgi:N-methylhydantoinase A